ncbi:Modulator of FtsH protease HflK [Limihaloglobus sulfuriphilus]|uniref:Modulator of FtsH protease HflK n=1 Tax=Limihaloglobus sulfuriphilus TaxID=1851148 RepID=A0A1Q2MHB8_9BACT|nr:protease modulator HflK [Limihaloglobus sulfuriphilus]AQQ71928.1 Modulator of FtsH protease HflK [Limihaloglobus sulfuriphilus]
MNTEENKTNTADTRPKEQETFLDAGSKSLSDALRLCFAMLKVVMVVLVVLYLCSGIFTVEKDEMALVLRFGKVVKDAQGQALVGPGLHWSMPYPIDEIVKIPATGTQKLAIDSFWYYQTAEEKLAENQRNARIGPTLNPVQDGYCLTRSDRVEGVEGNDYNILHCKWQLNYTIEDNPYLFFKNVYVRKLKAGEVFSDVIRESITPMLTSFVEDSVVTVLVNYSIDQATTTAKARIARDVKSTLQNKLDEIGSGIRVSDMQILDITWPRQVNQAFQASIKASQTSQANVTDARTYAEKTLSEAGGPDVLEILEGIKSEDTPPEQMEILWERLSGQAQEVIADARAYRTRVVENARANADYFRSLLPEYRKRPELVVQRIYQDAIEQVLANAEEKIIVQPSDGDKEREFRVLINRNPKKDSNKSDSNQN